LKCAPHLEFCRDLNRDLINHYQPKAVVVTGFVFEKRATELYGLNFEDGVTIPAYRSGRIEKHKLIRKYVDDVRPWIFTKHWSGSRGLSEEQQLKIREYLQSCRGDRTV
jgi:hypothetical protein